MAARLVDFDRKIRRRFVRGRKRPRAVAWFGAGTLWSYWCDIRNRLSAASRTVGADAPEPHATLLDRIANELNAQSAGGTLTERLGRDVWVDYVADTGDDVSISEAVARMIATPYDVGDPSRTGVTQHLPRGDILLFGGDSAYAVASARAIRARVVEPFSKEFALREDGANRVLLGIPGNHDWYDALRGFRSLFSVGAPLKVSGYGAVQQKSCFILPVAPKRVMFGLDRPAGTTPPQQLKAYRDFLGNDGSSTWLVLPEPDLPRGVRNGSESVAELGLVNGSSLVTAGDLHFYRREQNGRVIHVTAGGGGASLHSAAIGGGPPAAIEFPDRAQSRLLLGEVVPRMVLGRAGFLPHVVFAAASFANLTASVIFGAVLFLYLWSQGARNKTTALLAAIVALLAAMLPSIARGVAAFFATGAWAQLIAALIVVLFGTVLLGGYLMIVGSLGHAREYAFSSLAHPGFRHFLRLRVLQDGSAVHGYCIGMVDPLGNESAPVLVDRFEWR